MKYQEDYLTQLITKICSDIDEKSTDAYDAFKFNPRVLRKSLIQSSLQSYEKNHLSALFYLNEYYQRHFIIVVGDLYFETCLKSFLFYLVAMLLCIDYWKKDNKLFHCNLYWINMTYMKQALKLFPSCLICSRT